MPIFNDDDLASYEMPTTPAGVSSFDWSDDQSVDLAQLAKYGLDYTNLNKEEADNAAGDAKFFRINDPAFMSDAEMSGVGGDLLKMIGGFGSSASSFIKDNPELSKMFLGGLSAAQQQKLMQETQGMSSQQRLEYATLLQQYAKENAGTANQYAKENAAIANQYRIDAELRKQQEDKALWDRRNANIVGMGINAPPTITMAHTQPIIDSILKGRK